MRCFSCKRGISKVEQIKMVADFEQSDGTIKTYGFMCDDGPLKKAKGRLIRAYHFKHYQIMRKREARGGDVLTGRLLGTNVPTAYDITKLTANKDDLAQLGLTSEEAQAETTARFSERAAQIREMAAKAGSSMEDVEERERRNAVERGGPYVHTHYGSIDRHRLEAHLLWAHGYVSDERSYGVMGIKHGELHAQMTLEAKQAERRGDPGHVEPEERDWRDQHVADV